MPNQRTVINAPTALGRNLRVLPIDKESKMDLLFLGLIVGFFGASAWLVHFCFRLMGDKGRPS